MSRDNSRRRQWPPTPALLPGTFTDRGAWWAAVHGVAKSRARLGDFTFPFHFHALEKEMATHSSVLAWRIPGTGEPGGLRSMGSQSRTRLKRLSSSSSRDNSGCHKWEWGHYWHLVMGGGQAAVNILSCTRQPPYNNFSAPIRQ